jgi:K+-transporting ATPase ATPase C chain
MRTIGKATCLIVIMTILTGIVYPLLITGLTQVFFSEKANGSFILFRGRVVGSALIGQKFSSPRYFWPRPSSIDYNPLPSGGSNLGPTSADLLATVEERRKSVEKAHPESGTVPTILLFASGSGLDPHITPEAAKYQIERVARARGLDNEQKNQLIALVERCVESPVLGILGQPRINVLRLNLVIDSTLGGINP